jgi:predicted DNA-binding transcriptional regulator AlpA
MTNQANLQDTVLNERQVAAFLSVGMSTLQRWRSQGQGPSYVRLSTRRVGYRVSELHRWLASREMCPGQSPGEMPRA